MTRRAYGNERAARTKHSVQIVRCSLALAVATAVSAAGQVPEPPLDIRFDQKLNAQVPMDLMFRDSSGAVVELGSYFNDKPVLLSLVYYECPMLCTLTLNGMVAVMKEIPYALNTDYEAVTVSFDHEETHVLAAGKKKAYVESYDRSGAENAWHFLVGEKDQVDRLCEAVGFGFRYDPETDEYAHRSGIILLTPDGVVSKYLPGIEYPERDLRLGLVEASAGRIGTIVDRLSLLCYHYDPVAGSYSFVVMNIVRLGCFLTIGALAAFLGCMLFREHRQRRRGESGVDPHELKENPAN